MLPSFQRLRGTDFTDGLRTQQAKECLYMVLHTQTHTERVGDQEYRNIRGSVPAAQGAQETRRELHGRDRKGDAHERGPRLGRAALRVRSQRSIRKNQGEPGAELTPL